MREAGGSLASATMGFGALAAHGLSDKTSVTKLQSQLCCPQNNEEWRQSWGLARGTPTVTGALRAQGGEEQDMEHQG